MQQQEYIAPSMLPTPPPPIGESTYVVRLRMKLAQLVTENRRLRFDNGALRRELCDVRRKVRRRAL
jgi:hypothetical protein